MSTPLRVGVIGCGAIAQIAHIPYTIETPGLQLIALSDVYAPILYVVGERFGVPSSMRFTDWHDLIQHDDVDAVIVCHSGSHYDTVTAALDAGKHVMCEKPLAWNLREVQDIAAKAKTSSAILQLGYHKLYDRGFDYAKAQLDQIEDLAYAEITVLHSSNLYNRAPYPLLSGDGSVTQSDYALPDFDTYVNNNLQAAAYGIVEAHVDEALGDRKGDDRLRLAYGFLIGSIIHQVYTLHGFLGAPERVLYADTWRQGMSVVAHLLYPNAVRVALNWQYLPNLNRYHEEYAFFGNSRRVKFTLPGPYYRNFPSPVIVEGGDGELSWKKEVTVSYTEAFQNELVEFEANVREGKTPRTTADHAVIHHTMIQDIIDAMH